MLAQQCSTHFFPGVGGCCQGDTLLKVCQHQNIFKKTQTYSHLIFRQHTEQDVDIISPQICGGHPKLSRENIFRTEQFLYHFSGFRKETNKSLKNELKDSLQISRILETLLKINTCFSSRCLHPTVFVFFVLALFLLFSKHRTLLTFCVSEIKFAWTIDKSWVRYLGT